MCAGRPAHRGEHPHAGERSTPGLVRNVYCLPAGGGKFLAILQCRGKASPPRDEGRPCQVALTAFAAITELKPVVLVDDVDIFDSDDVLWAMTIRYNGDVSTVFLSSVRCHPLDPSQSPDFSPTIPAPGISCKTSSAARSGSRGLAG